MTMRTKQGSKQEAGKQKHRAHRMRASCVQIARTDQAAHRRAQVTRAYAQTSARTSARTMYAPEPNLNSTWYRRIEAKRRF